MQMQTNNPFRRASQTMTDSLPPPAYERYDRTSPAPSTGYHRTPSPVRPTSHAANKEAEYPFGSPFASNPSWSPTEADYATTSIPSRSFKDKIKNRFARTAGDIFSPPALSFARPLPPLGPAAQQPFQSIIIKGDGDALADSFKPEYPGRILAPRDVSIADFARFLEDIAVAGRLEGKQQLISIAAPLTAHMGFAGHFVTKGIQKRMTRAKEPLCIEAIEHWCAAFFVPRGLDVFVVSMSEGRLTARRPNGEVPDAPRELAMLTSKVERESSSSDEDDNGHGQTNSSGHQQSGVMDGQGFGRRGRGRGRGRGIARMGGGTDSRADRRSERRAKRHDKFYLVIAPLATH